MNSFIEIVRTFDWPVIVAVVGAVWYFRRDMKKDNKEFKEQFAERMNKHEERMEKMQENMHKEFKFFNIRLSRVEGNLYGKDIYKTDKPEV